MKTLLYCDYNATSPLLYDVKEAMLDIIDQPLNPSSVHLYGRNAKTIIENARNDIAIMMGVSLRNDQYDLVFTASATEANNLVISNFIKNRILIASTEHISILRHQEYSDNVDILPVNNIGIVDIDKLELWLKQNPGPSNLVSIMFANNETGVLQPIKEIVSLVHQYESLIHSDCVQMPGKMQCDILDLGLDFVSITAHKFGGPLGAAALIYKSQYHLRPQMIGGGQERGIRAGTENVLAITGFAKAANMAQPQNSMMRDFFEDEIMDICKSAIIFGKDAPRLPNTSMIYMPDIPANLQVIKFDMQGIAVSSGSACSSGKVKISHVLTAMGVVEEVANCAIRFSFGPKIKKTDIIRLVNIWRNIYQTT